MNDFNSFDHNSNNTPVLPFKLINNGLGFHKKKLELKRVKSNDSLIQENSKSIDMIATSELAAFYAASSNHPIEEVKIEQVQCCIEAKLSARFIAWSIDLIFISLINCLIVSSVLLFFPVQSKLLFLQSNIFSIVMILPVLYLVYFALTERVFKASCGKMIMNLKLHSTQRLISLNLLVLRILYSLASFGLFNLLGLHDKLTGVRVIKNGQ
jgi:hypothetical protein